MIFRTDRPSGRGPLRSSLIVLAALIGTGYYLYHRYAFASEDPTYMIGDRSESGTVHIGMIGDSWIAESAIDSVLREQLALYGLATEVYASGVSGASSKAIYRDLIKGSRGKGKSREVMAASPHYMVNIAGVNDMVGHLGPDFYAHHLVQMARTEIAHDMVPVILVLPRFDLKGSATRQSLPRRVRNTVGSWMSVGDHPDPIGVYREALDDALIRHRLDKKVIRINFDDICACAINCPTLYRDPAHLSPAGNRALAELIAKGILAHIAERGD